MKERLLDTNGLILFAAQARSIWEFLGQYWYVLLAPLLGMIAIYLLLPKARQSNTLLGAVLGAAALILAGTILVQLEVVWVESLLFYAFAAIAILGGSSLITHSQPVRAALSFALVILSTCGLFLLLGAPFLMAATIIVYAGAIIVTFLFVIMLAQQTGMSNADHRSREPLLATLASFVLVASLFCVLRANYNSREIDRFLTSIQKAAQADSAKEVEQAIGAFARFDRDNDDELSPQEIRKAFVSLYDGPAQKDGKLDDQETSVAFRSAINDPELARAIIAAAITAANDDAPEKTVTLIEPAIRVAFFRRFIDEGKSFKQLDDFQDALLEAREPLLAIPIDFEGSYQAAHAALEELAKAGAKAEPSNEKKKAFDAYLQRINEAAKAPSTFEIEKVIGVLKNHHKDSSLLLNANEAKSALMELFDTDRNGKLDKREQKQATAELFSAYTEVVRRAVEDLRDDRLTDDATKLFDKQIRKESLKAFVNTKEGFTADPDLHDKLLELRIPLLALVDDDKNDLTEVKQGLQEVAAAAQQLRRQTGSLKPPANLKLSPFNGVPPNREPHKPSFEAPPNNVAGLGRSLFTHYLLAVELAGLLLLVASIGAIAIAGRRSGELQ